MWQSAALALACRMRATAAGAPGGTSWRRWWRPLPWPMLGSGGNSIGGGRLRRCRYRSPPAARPVTQVQPEAGGPHTRCRITCTSSLQQQQQQQQNDCVCDGFANKLAINLQSCTYSKAHPKASVPAALHARERWGGAGCWSGLSSQPVVACGTHLAMRKGRGKARTWLFNC
jgi:hypothetical protein